MAREWWNSIGVCKSMKLQLDVSGSYYSGSLCYGQVFVEKRRGRLQINT